MPRSPINAMYQALFEEFNRQYFAGRLPHYRVVVEPSIHTTRDTHGRVYRRQRLIKLWKRLDHNMMVATLLHEMAHVAAPDTPDAHGKEWKAEIQRLRQIGAPLGVIDYAHALPRPTQKAIRATGSDALDENPRITLRQFVRWYARDNGFSAAGLLRRYPWVREVFLSAKREHRKQMREEEGRRKYGLLPKATALL